MKVLIPTLGKRIIGPETWRKDLVRGLKKKNCSVIEFNSNNIKGIFKALSNISKVDVIHAYNESIGSLITILVAKILHKKVIYTLHGDYFLQKENKKGLKKILWIPFNKMCINLSNTVTFPSNQLHKDILKKEPHLKDRSIIIPNGIDIEKIRRIKKYTKGALGLKKSDFLIVEITNFNYKMKAAGIDLLVKEFKQFNKQNKNSYLFIIGGGKFFQDYKQKYENDKIKFLGFKQDAIKYIKACDLFAHYSFLDSFGIILLEAMACKKPIIAKGFLSSKEILDNLFSLSTLNKKDLRNLKQQSKKKIIQYNSNTIAKKFVEVYKR